MPKQSYHHGNLRAALVDAGLRAIAEDGPDRFSLRDVARRAGVSAPAVYRHFRDKDELFAAIAVDCVERMRVVMDAAIAEAAPDPLSRFRASGVAYVRFAVAHPAHFRALCVPGLSARAPIELRQAYAQRHAAESAALAAGQAAGSIAPLPLPELLLAAQAIVHGLAHLIVQGDLGEVDAARAEQLALEVTHAIGVGFYPRVAADPFRASSVSARGRSGLRGARRRRARGSRPRARRCPRSRSCGGACRP